MPTTNTERPTRLLYPIPEVLAALGGISRAQFYALLAAGDLRAVKLGRRTFVTAQALDAYVARLNRGAA